MSRNRNGHRFRSRVERVGSSHCIDLEPRLTRALRAHPERPHPVRVVLGGLEFDTRLAPIGDGTHRLVLPAWVWKDLHASPGDVLVGHLWTHEPETKR